VARDPLTPVPTFLARHRIEACRKQVNTLVHSGTHWSGSLP